MASPATLIDPFGRHIEYLRISVTDRCDFRCLYCMAEDMDFLPKREILSLEELRRLCRAFIRRGVRKIRITGGEPLVRRDIMWLFNALGTEIDRGTLDELTLTTNGSQLDRFAHDLKAAGVRRINVSLDSLDPDRFRVLTRRGDLATVLKGLDAADQAGLKVKINMVALKSGNEDEIDQMISWCGTRGYDLTLIETMPLGEVDISRHAQFLPLSAVREDLEQRWTFDTSDYRTGGPSRYVRIRETGGRLGFITPLTNNFCAGCNRVRVTCTGRIYMCLGQDDHVDLRAPLRESGEDNLLDAAIDRAIGRKPEAHDFTITPDRDGPSVSRFMSTTGG
jgi:cyclic pyranopterin phosphate synthase